MSGPIRKLIGPAKTRLQGYCHEADKLLSSPVREETMEDEELMSEDLIGRMNTNVTLLERCNRDWVNLLKELSGEAKTAEDAEYSRVAGGNEGFIEILLNANEAVARLRTRLERIEKRRLKKVVLNPDATAFQSNVLESSIQNSPQDLSSQGYLNVSLPKLQLLTFAGDIQQWPEFWDLFKSSVHEQNLPKVSKFSYLKGVLKGSAATAISGISVTTENYDLAITLLKEKFGKKEAIIESLYAKLQNLPKANNKFSEIKYNHEVTEKVLRQLEAQGESVNDQRMLVQQLLCKYPTDVIVKLEESKEPDTSWSISTLRKAITQYVTVQENAYRYVNNERNKFTESPRSVHRSSADVFTNNVSGIRRLPCIFCKGDHYNDECDKYVTLPDRKKKLSQQARCFICLKVGHVSKSCPSSQKKPCAHCGKKAFHNRCLCPEKFGIQPANSNTGPSGSASDYTSSDNSNTTTTQSLLASGEKVLLQTATVLIQTSDGGGTIKARVLLDSASQRTFMTNQLAQKLNLSLENKEILSVSTFGAQKATDIHTYVVCFKVKLKDGTYMTISANVLNQITGSIQRSPLVQKDLEFLKAIPAERMADCLPDTLENTTIDLLIGSDYFWDIIGNDKVTLPSGMFLIPSKFGYIVTGKFPDNKQCLCNLVHTLFVTAEVGQVTHGLENLWRLETIGIKDPMVVETDEEALRKFNETIQFKDGRYQVAWPWKNEDVCLPENFNLAMGRLRSLIYRLKSDATLVEKYNHIIQQQLQDGVIEVVDKSVVSDTRKHYLPHHPVITPSKATTKVRIVYDASAKGKVGDSSLNECLYRGPVILPDLCGVLLRFRLYYIVILADIEKAFLQLGIQSGDRDVTRFLWFKDIATLEVSDSNVIMFRFCRVPFGLICSPFLLAATIKYHLQKEDSPLATHIQNNIYVDNVLIGVESVKEAYKAYQEAKIIFERASMNLREWNSNSTDFLNSITAAECVNGDISKVFGLLWNRVDDTFCISGPDYTILNSVTKREALHYIAKVFDPLGLLVPVTFYGKVFIQNLWNFKLQWDQSLPANLMESWTYITTLFKQIPLIKIPRFVGIVDKSATYQLLVFCDASIKAYAASVYLRIKDEAGVKTHLMFSKMRLVPMNKGERRKELTIPRLELLAVLIGIRAANFVAKELRLKITDRILWTDSQCVLYWLKTKKPLSVFVENRIREIKLEEDVTFRYVPTLHNPSDYATRGLSVQEIVCSSLWWHGPSWLQDEDTLWPVRNPSDTTPEVLQQANNEVRKSNPEVSHVTVDEGKWLPFGIDQSRYSSLRKLLRVTILVFRFIKIKIWNQLSSDNKKLIQQHKLLITILSSLGERGPVTASEIKLICLLWIFAIQHKYFEEIYSALQHKRKNCLQMQLGLKVDEFQILRCYGHYANAVISDEMKYPKLLPRRIHFTKLVIMEVHLRLVHAGVSHTLGQIRQQYWIPQGRAEVRCVLLQCTVCKRHGGPPFSLPNMPSWPQERVSRSEPFQYIGLDYLGPLRVKEGNGIEKMWICLFTCLAVRAIHLELVKGLSAPLFLDCLKRFIARRGKPKLIISDNAPQFRLVKTTLDMEWNKTFKSSEVLDYFSHEVIQWNFTTALAPWQGGFYERLIGLVKQGLRKGMGRKVLYWDKLMTLTVEVEAIINTRPLTYVYEDFKSGFVLTPAHFLTGNHKVAVPFSEDVCEDSDYYPKIDSVKELTEYWRRNQKQLNLFWEFWKQEYLLSLRETSPLRHKGIRSQLNRQPKLGEVVVVKDDYLPRGAWKLAQIKQFIFSKDGLIRSVKIQLPNKTVISRAINHLFPLEISSVANTDCEFSLGDDNEIVCDNSITTCDYDERPPRRKAAAKAHERILEQLKPEPACVIFSFPRECHGENTIK